MTPYLSYYWEGGREGESSARILNGMKKKKNMKSHACTPAKKKAEYFTDTTRSDRVWFSG